MEYTRNGLSLYEEQITIEQTAEEEIAELRKKLKVLQESNKESRLLNLLRKKNIRKLLRRLFKAEGKIYELENQLVEQKRHADKMDDLAWENWENKNKAEKERDDLKTELIREKENSNNLQIKLREIENKLTKRNWESFYDWLLKERIEKNYSLEVLLTKEEARKHGIYTEKWPGKFQDGRYSTKLGWNSSSFKVEGFFPSLKKDFENIYPSFKVKVCCIKYFAIFLKALLKGQGKVGTGAYDSNSPYQFSYLGGENRYEITISPYIENKPIEYFFSEQISKKALNDFCWIDLQKLFDEWKHDTPLLGNQT